MRQILHLDFILHSVYLDRQADSCMPQIPRYRHYLRKRYLVKTKSVSEANSLCSVTCFYAWMDHLEFLFSPPTSWKQRQHALPCSLGLHLSCLLWFKGRRLELWRNKAVGPQLFPHLTPCGSLAEPGESVTQRHIPLEISAEIKLLSTAGAAQICL